MTRFVLIAIVFVVGIVAIVSGRRHAATEPLCKDCNVLLVAIDTVGATHLPCYGYERNTMPNLCAIAEQEILFSRAFTTATWTLPADVSMFTSLYPQYHAITNYRDYSMRLPPNTGFLPEILKNNGYRTLFAIPARDRAFPVRDVYYRGISEVIPVGVGPDEHFDAALTRFAENAAAGKTFMYLHSYAAHGPYIIGNEKKRFTTDTFADIPTTWDGIYGRFSQDFYEYLLDELSATIGKPNSTVSREVYEALKNAPTLEAAHTIAKQHAAELDSYYTEYFYFANVDLTDSRQVEYIKALYDQKLYDLDVWIGETLVPFLKDNGLWENTIVLFTSEHGEEFLEHGRLSHETLYDSNVSVPFILHIPGVSRVTVSVPVTLIDVPPTILQMTGIKAAGVLFQGEDLSPAIAGDHIVDRLVYAFQFQPGGRHVKTLRNARWKLFTINDFGTYVPYALFDLRTDPGEQQDVLHAHFDVARTMLKQAETDKKQWGAVIRTLE